ncbi:sensor domain-containing diguanylate cyclase [Thiovibrio sp. JS02]
MFSSNCLKVFVGLSLSAALVLPTYVYFFLSPDFRQLVVDNSETEAKRVSNHLISSFILDPEDASGQAVHNRLVENEAAIKKNFQVEEFKYFSASGRILYSSDHADIGRVNEKPYFREVVARGQSYTKVVEEGARTLEGRVVPVAVVETYVPIMRDGKFSGAFEIYYDITRAKASLDKLMAKVYTVLTVIAGVMVLLTFFSFCRARKGMAAKRLLDEEKEKNFQTEVIFNKLFQLSLVKTSLREILEIFICHLASFPGIALEPKGAVFLVAENTKRLELAAQRGLDPELLAGCGGKPAGECGRRQNTETTPCFFPAAPDEDQAGRAACMAAHGHYCIPIQSAQGELLGVFTLYPKAGQGHSERAEKIFLAVANLIAGIIERKQLEDKLRDISISDELTGLFNRRGFRTLAQQELDLAQRQQTRMAVFYIDLDGLKQINDRFGHNAGDQAIKDTAEILKETFRAADVIARIGGDEFAVFGSFSPETGSSDALRQRLAERIRLFNDRKERRYAVSCSVGVAHVVPGGRGGLDEVLSRADSAMYEEKMKKRSGTVFACNLQALEAGEGRS